MIGDPGRNETSGCYSTVVSRRSKSQRWTIQGNGENAVGTFLWDVYGVWYMTKKIISARKRRRQGKQPLDEETTCPKRDLDKDWVEDWLTDGIHPNEPNLGRVRVRTSICERKSAGTV